MGNAGTRERVAILHLGHRNSHSNNVTFEERPKVCKKSSHADL